MQIYIVKRLTGRDVCLKVYVYLTNLILTQKILLRVILHGASKGLWHKNIHVINIGLLRKRHNGYSSLNSSIEITLFTYKYK